MHHQKRMNCNVCLRPSRPFRQCRPRSAFLPSFFEFCSPSRALMHPRWSRSCPTRCTSSSIVRSHQRKAPSRRQMNSHSPNKLKTRRTRKITQHSDHGGVCRPTCLRMTLSLKVSDSSFCDDDSCSGVALPPSLPRQQFAKQSASVNIRQVSLHANVNDVTIDTAQKPFVDVAMLCLIFQRWIQVRRGGAREGCAARTRRL